MKLDTPPINLVGDETNPAVLKDGRSNNFQIAALHFFQVKRFESFKQLIRAEEQSFVRHSVNRLRSEISANDFGVVLNFGGCAVGDNHAVFEDVNALADSHDQTHVVFD